MFVVGVKFVFVFGEGWVMSFCVLCLCLSLVLGLLCVVCFVFGCVWGRLGCVFCILCLRDCGGSIVLLLLLFVLAVMMMVTIVLVLVL